MKKFLTAVMIVFSTCGFADDLKLLSQGDLSVKSIVKVKLWYEGIEITKENTANMPNNTIVLSEELETALDKLDT